MFITCQSQDFNYVRTLFALGQNCLKSCDIISYMSLLQEWKAISIIFLLFSILWTHICGSQLKTFSELFEITFIT